MEIAMPECILALKKQMIDKERPRVMRGLFLFYGLFFKTLVKR